MTGPVSYEPDLVSARDQAFQWLRAGRVKEARRLLWTALRQTYALETEYAPAVALLGQVLEAEGQPRAALTCAWYTADERVIDRLHGQVPLADRARCWLARAYRSVEQPQRKKGLHSQAAAEFENAGLVVQAAVQREKAGEHELARTLWSRLSQTMRDPHEADLYAAALARFNLARTARQVGDARAAREATVTAVHFLEEAADRYETVGLRERAFDCYQVLTAIGRDLNVIEHALEGYVNLTRILREDQLRTYALRHYHEAIGFLQNQGEIAAAATVAREMASYARREALYGIANYAVLMQAQMWRQLAAITLQRGGPPEIAENSLLAAVLAYAELGQFRRVGDVYVELAHLPLEAARRANYARAAGRYTDARDEALDASPEAEVGLDEHVSLDVWHLDLIEWEQKGVASEVCAEILIDPGAWSEVLRRRALLARLVALSVETQPQPSAEALEALVDALAPTELYSTLASLETLLRSPEARVRAAVAQVLGRFLYKRSFIGLRQALSDSEPLVRERACQSLEQLHFPHAFDPLARIYREATDSSVRLSALRALCCVDSDEAAEMVLGVLQHAGPSERAKVVTTLSHACGSRVLRLISEALPQASGELARAFREVLRARGVR